MRLNKETTDFNHVGNAGFFSILVLSFLLITKSLIAFHSNKTPSAYGQLL